MAVWGCDSAELCLVLMVMDCVVCVAAACAFLLCFFWLFRRLIEIVVCGFLLFSCCADRLYL